MNCRRATAVLAAGIWFVGSIGWAILEYPEARHGWKTWFLFDCASAGFALAAMIVLAIGIELDS